MPSRIPPIQPVDINPHWKFLCEEIGERRAGSAAEHRSAEYIRRQFDAAGLNDIRLEAFECNLLRSASASLEILDVASWIKVPCDVLVGSPSTEPAVKPTEMELVWVEMPEQAGRLKPGSMTGKALALFGQLATDTQNHRAIVRSGAALVIWIDDRLPFEWAKADAILPVWRQRVGALPTVAVALRSAYDWRTRGVKRVRGCVATENVPATSYNVVADLPGRDAKAGMLAFGCHYDTQVGNVGADDNASGTVGVIALANAFAFAARKKPFARTIRFIAFGTEEQLSVGARAYAIEHRKNMNRHALMINLDSLSCALGHTQVMVAGSTQLEKWMVKNMESCGVSPRVFRQVTPFADHFPFTMFGVPALWFARPNFGNMRWQHHSPHDNLATVSADTVCMLLNAIAPMAEKVADSRSLPFKAGIDKQERPEIKRMALELFDMKI